MTKCYLVGHYYTDDGGRFCPAGAFLNRKDAVAAARQLTRVAYHAAQERALEYPDGTDHPWDRDWNYDGGVEIREVPLNALPEWEAKPVRILPKAEWMERRAQARKLLPAPRSHSHRWTIVPALFWRPGDPPEEQFRAKRNYDWEAEATQAQWEHRSNVVTMNPEVFRIE